MVQANCRAQLTADDFAYVVQALAKSPSEAVSLVSLLTDLDTRDAVLDHDLLYSQLIDDTGCLKVSPALYFYVLTRRVLRRAGLEERALSDYIAAMLVAFSRMNRLTPTDENANPRHFSYLSDMLDALDKAPPEQAFLRRCHVGDYALFFSGIFADRVLSHAGRRGGPGLSLYVSIGRTCYRTVAHHPQARRADLHRIFDQLADDFDGIRQALSHLAENLLHVHTPAPVLIVPRPL